MTLEIEILERFTKCVLAEPNEGGLAPNYFSHSKIQILLTNPQIVAF